MHAIIFVPTFKSNIYYSAHQKSVKMFNLLAASLDDTHTERPTQRTTDDYL